MTPPGTNALWVDEGNDPDYARARANQVNTICRSIRDPRTTAAALKADLDAGFASCVYFAANWYDLPAAELATTVSRRLEQVAPKSQPSRPAVCADIEVADLAAYVLAFAAQWRKHRPHRVTDLTIEGHKGGLIGSSGPAIAARFRFLVPQCYNGLMTEVWDTLEMARDLTAVGVPLEQVVPFHDAAKLPAWWSGYAFTQGRLP